MIGAGTTLEVRDSSRDVEPGLSPGTYDAPSGLRRGDSYTAEVYVPRPDQEQMAQSTSGAEERQRGQRTLLVPFRPGETAPPSQGNITGETVDPSTVTEALVRFGAWDGSDDSAAGYPSLRRSEFDVEAVMERSVYARTWELVQELKRDKETAMDYVRAVDEYLSGPEFRYVERPTQPPAGLAPLDFFINESHEGYCQHYAGAMALMLRMGGVPARVATGFSPGGYSDRKKAWIVRDTDAHAWVEIWFDEYGWVTVDPTPSATPARSLVGALAPDLDSTSAGAQADTGADDAASGDASPLSVRPELQTGGVGELDVAADEGGTPWWLYAPRRDRACSAWCSRSCSSCAARAGRRRWTARSPRSRTRCAASGGRSRPGRR